MINYETLKHVIRVLLITVLTLKVARFHPNSRISTIGITTKNINIINNKKKLNLYNAILKHRK